MKHRFFRYSIFLFIVFFAAGSVSAAEGVIDCGEDIIGIPITTARIIRNAYILIKILVPLVLIFLGMLDFGKAVMGSNADEIKKKQTSFIKRLIAAVVVFLVLSIVELVFALLASAGVPDLTSCIDAILNGKF